MPFLPFLIRNVLFYIFAKRKLLLVFCSKKFFPHKMKGEQSVKKWIAFPFFIRKKLLLVNVRIRCIATKVWLLLCFFFFFKFFYCCVPSGMLNGVRVHLINSLYKWIIREHAFFFAIQWFYIGGAGILPRNPHQTKRAYVAL